MSFGPYERSINSVNYVEINLRAFTIERVSNRIILVSTHWGRDKMAAISQTTFSNAFSWMKIYKIR